MYNSRNRYEVFIKQILVELSKCLDIIDQWKSEKDSLGCVIQIKVISKYDTKDCKL